MASSTAIGVDNNDLGIIRESCMSHTGSHGSGESNGECLDIFNRNLDEIIDQLERLDPESLI